MRPSAATDAAITGRRENRTSTPPPTHRRCHLCWSLELACPPSQPVEMNGAIVILPRIHIAGACSARFLEAGGLEPGWIVSRKGTRCQICWCPAIRLRSVRSEVQLLDGPLQNDTAPPRLQAPRGRVRSSRAKIRASLPCRRPPWRPRLPCRLCARLEPGVRVRARPRCEQDSNETGPLTSGALRRCVPAASLSEQVDQSQQDRRIRLGDLLA